MSIEQDAKEKAEALATWLEGNNYPQAAQAVRDALSANNLQALGEAYQAIPDAAGQAAQAVYEAAGTALEAAGFDRAAGQVRAAAGQAGSSVEKFFEDFEWGDGALALIGALGLTTVANFMTSFISDPEQRGFLSTIGFGVLVPLAVLAGGAYMLYKAGPSKYVGNFLNDRSLSPEDAGNLTVEDYKSRSPEAVHAAIDKFFADNPQFLDQDKTAIDPSNANFDDFENGLEAIPFPAGESKFEIVRS